MNNTKFFTTPEMDADYAAGLGPGVESMLADGTEIPDATFNGIWPTKTQTLTEIAKAHRLPPSLLNDLMEASYSSAVG